MRQDCLFAAVARSMGSVVNKACDLAKPAAALAVIALLWRRVHPTSYQLGQAILVAVNLSAGYNETKRQAATGRIASGEHLLHELRQQFGLLSPAPCQPGSRSRVAAVWPASLFVTVGYLPAHLFLYIRMMSSCSVLNCTIPEVPDQEEHCETRWSQKGVNLW